MQMTRSAGGVVVGHDGRVLLTGKDNGRGGYSWSLPKGHIEPGESDIDAARREIAEETGVTDLTLVKHLGEFQRFKIGKDDRDDVSEYKTIVIYLFTTVQTQLAPRDPENPVARWFHRDDVALALKHRRDAAFFISIIGQLP